MAKVIILNATEKDLNLKATWATGIGGSDHHATEKTVKAWETNYVDDVLYDLHFTVTMDGGKVYQNSGSIKGPDSYSYLAYRRKSCNGDINVGHHHNLTDSYPTQMLALARVAYELEKIKNKTTEQIDELNNKIKELSDNDMQVDGKYPL